MKIKNFVKNNLNKILILVIIILIILFLFYCLKKNKETFQLNTVTSPAKSCVLSDWINKDNKCSKKCGGGIKRQYKKIIDKGDPIRKDNKLVYSCPEEESPERKRNITCNNFPCPKYTRQNREFEDQACYCECKLIKEV